MISTTITMNHLQQFFGLVIKTNHPYQKQLTLFCVSQLRSILLHQTNAKPKQGVRPCYGERIVIQESTQIINLLEVTFAVNNMKIFWQYSKFNHII